MIEIKDLSYSHRAGGHVLQGLSASFAPGLVHALMGANGSGKSTLLHLLSGLARPGCGSVRLDGHDPFARRLATLGDIALLPQMLSPGRLDSRAYGQTYGALWPRFSGSTFFDALDRFAVDPSRPQSCLAPGTLRKARLAFTLATGARVLLLDEPAEGLDIDAKSVLRSLLAEAADPRRTIILATHGIREFEGLVDHVSILGRKRLLLHAPTDVLGTSLLFASGPTPPEDALHSMPRAGGFAFILPGDGRSSRPDLEMLYQAVAAEPGKLPDFGVQAS